MSMEPDNFIFVGIQAKLHCQNKKQNSLFAHKCLERKE